MIDPTEAALLRAAADGGADDTPRLVYADWLDDHGDGPRAEFIRVQCEGAKAADPHPFRVRERELLTAHRRAWCDAFGVPLEDVAFERGLITRARLAKWDARFLDDDIAPRFATLTELDLSGLGLDYDAASAFATSARLPALRKLMLNDNALSAHAASALATARGLPQLDTLYLFGNTVGPKGRAALLTSSRFRLTTLDLGERADGYCLSRGQTEMARRVFLRTRLLPHVATFFEKYERLQSAALCVAQYWNDEADDAVHGDLVVSELFEPTLGGVNYNYEEDQPGSDPNVPNTVIKGEHGESGSVVSFWHLGWDSNSRAIPLWAAFAPEGGSQEFVDLAECYAPAVRFYRHGGYDILPMIRPHLDGVRPEWGWEGE